MQRFCSLGGLVSFAGLDMTLKEPFGIPKQLKMAVSCPKSTLDRVVEKVASLGPKSF